jgi:hypothetical protein
MTDFHGTPPTAKNDVSGVFQEACQTRFEKIFDARKSDFMAIWTVSGKKALPHKNANFCLPACSSSQN